MPDLAAFLDPLDARRAEFLAGLDSIPPEQLGQAPTSKAWSPLGIGEHLLIVERGLGHVAGRQIEKGEGRKRFGEPSAKSVDGLVRAMRTPSKFKVPDGVGIEPTGEVSLGELRQAWGEAGAQWHRVAETLPPDLADEGLVMHAVAGPMTIAQTLRFLEAHIEHHQHQLVRTVRALSARAA
ncbi:MAG: DinB family protein [Bacteroidota bacterium]